MGISYQIKLINNTRLFLWGDCKILAIIVNKVNYLPGASSIIADNPLWLLNI
jgi:hypothetical protein